MANEKFKLIFDNDGKTVTITENHPKLTATSDDMNSAMNGVAGFYGYDPVRIDLQSDTTIWTLS